MADAPMKTPEIVHRSYEVLAILSTCELALGAVRESHVGADTGDISVALRVAHRLAGDVHDALEALAPQEGANG